VNYLLAILICLKLIQTFTCSTRTQLDTQMTTIFHFLELIYLRILFAILVQCRETLLNPMLPNVKLLIYVYINYMSSQKTSQCMIYCSIFSILSTKLRCYCFLSTVNSSNCLWTDMFLLIHAYYLTRILHKQVQVLWNGVSSCNFSVSNGVKQGAIVRQILFCMYLDTLLTELKKAGVGCFIGKWFVSVLGYADDVVLLAPTARAMRTMLKVCDKFSGGFSVIFNAKKSECLTFNTE